MDPRTSPVQRFFDVSVDMLCLAGTDGYFKTLNQAWSETLGYQDGELLQKPFVDFVHPDDRQATIDASAKVAGGQKLVSFRNRYRCKDGTYKWLAWTAAPALSDGTIYAAARDVTAEVLAEATGIVQSEEQRARVLAVMEDDRVRAVFQPVVNLANLEVGGYEALARFDTAPVMPPDQWFEAAHAAGLGPELEIHAIHKAISHAYQLPTTAFLSVNASPQTLLTDEFSRLMMGLHGASLVVEVTEHAVVTDYEPLQRAIDTLRQHGVRLAIDDAGAGFASLKHIVRLLPEFIKLDIFLVHDIHKDPVKRAVVAGMLGVASQIGGKVIAEGVETAEDLRVLFELGVEWAQGFYLGRPGPIPSGVLSGPMHPWG
ncbi:MAG TPA: EAL domain-containing protein [Candidatus Dormibacteraeota bacterium]